MAEIVKARLMGQSEELVQLLHDYEFHNIVGGNRITFAFDDTSKGSCKLDVETLAYRRWSDGSHGDIFTLIQAKTGCSFKEALMDLRSKLGITSSSYSMTKVETVSKHDLFGGMFDRMQSLMGEAIYSDRDIDKFEKIISQTFRHDGIGVMTQDDFDIRYDKETDRIVILWRNVDGEVVGCNARKNKDMPEDYKYKYLSLLPFAKGHHLFGLFENYMDIKDSKTVAIFEAEKSTLQADTFGVNTCVSLGCSSMRREQADLLYNTGARNWILCFDDGIEYLHYVNTSMQIKEWHSDVNVYAMYDRENKYIKEGSKDSPTDNGLEVFTDLMKECIIKLV